MKTKIMIFYFAFFMQYSFSQFTSLDVNYDARSIAMGESMVACTNGFTPVDVNPATLIGLKGLSFSYNHRSVNLWNEDNSWYKDDNMDCYSFALGLKSSIGCFAFTYKRFDHNRLGIYDVPAYVGSDPKTEDHTLIFTYSNSLVKNLNFGLNIKTHKFSYVLPNTDHVPKTNSPLLFDLGLIYKINKIIKAKNVRDGVNIGASIQNIGTQYKLRSYNSEDNFDLPRYFRFGFSYELNLMNSENENIFKFILNNEYRELLNENYDDIGAHLWGLAFGAMFYGIGDCEDCMGVFWSYNNKNETHFWSIGSEVSFYDIIFFRVGGSVFPFESVYGNERNFSIRYGIGLNLPLSMIGLKYPVSLIFDYTVIPLHNQKKYIYSDKPENLNAFNIGMNWDGVLF